VFANGPTERSWLESVDTTPLSTRFGTPVKPEHNVPTYWLVSPLLFENVQHTPDRASNWVMTPESGANTSAPWRGTTTIVNALLGPPDSAPAAALKKGRPDYWITAAPETTCANRCDETPTMAPGCGILAITAPGVWCWFSLLFAAVLTRPQPMHWNPQIQFSPTIYIPSTLLRRRTSANFLRLAQRTTGPAGRFLLAEPSATGCCALERTQGEAYGNSWGKWQTRTLSGESHSLPLNESYLRLSLPPNTVPVPSEF